MDNIGDLEVHRDDQGTVMYGPMAQDLYNGEPVSGEGQLETIDYACGDRLIQSDRRVTPSTCPDCGEGLSSGGEADG